MPQLQSYYLPPTPCVENIPPIPPRTRSRPPSRQQTLPPAIPKQPPPPPPPKTFLFRIDDLPSPDREWQLFENIGDGTYGEVFRAKNIRNPDFNAAVKIMHPTNDVLDEIEQEYRVLLELSSHENLCRFYGAYLKRAPPPPLPPPRSSFREPSPSISADKTNALSIEVTSTSAQLDQLWLVMELCTSGSVTDLAKSMLKANERVDETIIAYIMRETLKALHHLHSNNVVHRDVKGHNILITGDGHIKLIDFGVSAYLNPHNGRRNTSVGTPFFMAPEVIACERQIDSDYDTRADVWSTGITAIEIAEGEPPLAEMHPMRALVSIPRNPPPTLRHPHDWSPEFNDFIRQCLIKNFEIRPTVGQILTHPFLTRFPVDGNEARHRIVQIVQRYKRCYDLCVKKTSRETCGVKNGHIRGKSETCSSVTIAAANTTTADEPSVAVPPPKRILQIVPKPSDLPKRPAPPPPPSTTTTTGVENGYKTKRKSPSNRVAQFYLPNANAAEDLPVCHPSLSKKSAFKQFFNSTYDSAYPNSSISTDDLAQLETFDEQTIITHMYNRFLANQIYTYIGDILLAVNPFRNLPIYGKDMMSRYRSSVKSEQAPHIFALADLTYQSMLHNAENQYIVISGESGSGKTQSANFLVKQLTYLGNAPSKILQDKILQINPLIEGFGNARTIINDNSSRFGKYLELLFTKQGQVTGARLSEYLLEKTRVVYQACDERNFHIFYYLFHGLASNVANDQHAFYLVKNQTYRYLKTDFEQRDDYKEKFFMIEKCFQIIGFDFDEIKSIYRILAGLLHLGNINFHQNEGHFIDGKTCLTDRYLLNIVCELFGLDLAEFELALTTSNIVTRGETIQRSTTLQESQSTRDAMAKALYNRLFSWIVNRISSLLAPSNLFHSIQDDQTSIQSHRYFNANNNNNNNNNNNIDDESENEADGTFSDEYNPSNRTTPVLPSYAPQTVMCAMRRTLDYLDMTPSSSSFLYQLPQSEIDDDDDDDEDLNINNNNNNSSSSISNQPAKSTLINDLSNDKPVKNLIENWSKVVAAASKQRSTSEMNLHIKAKLPNDISKPCQSTANLYLQNKPTFNPPLINKQISSDEDSDTLKIAILDIFGFENLSTNSFEQLCINIANEQIQYYFNQHVFASEKQEYINENLSILPFPITTDLTFYDNRPLLDMFLNKPVGILALIDEESRFPKATDYTLVDKLNANFSSSPLYIRSKSSFSSNSISSSSSSIHQSSIPSFSILHFAGQVQYNALDFLDKNRDYLAPEIIHILRQSTVQLISSLFQMAPSKAGTLFEHEQMHYDSATIDQGPLPFNGGLNRVQATVSTSFRYSLTDLFAKMTHGSPRFIRCFKPNNERIPGCFDTSTVLEQLKYSGILAAAKIRRFGYSHRIPFANFVQRYSILVYPATMDLPLTRETCENILHKLKMHNWTAGKSKIFLKYYHAEQLTHLHSEMMKAIVTIQSYIRMRIARLRIRNPIFEELSRHPKFSQSKTNLHQATVCIQSHIRSYIVRRQQQLTPEHAALIIQKAYRGYAFRKTFHLYKQRLNVQTLCFLQQIELINNDFCTKIIRTNYSVPLKALESCKQITTATTIKLFQHLFPAPLPLPLPKTNEISRPMEIINRTTNVPLAPTPTSIAITRQQLIPVNRSPSPVSKFAQVRDIFARAEAPKSIRMKHTFTPKPIANVHSAVQEYQKQHIQNQQPNFKRFVQLAPQNTRSRPNPPLTGFNQQKFGNHRVNLPAYVTSSPQQQIKPISRQPSTSTQPRNAFQVLLRKTGQDLTMGNTLTKRRYHNETKQIDFRNVLKSRHTINGTTDNDIILRANSLSH